MRYAYFREHGILILRCEQASNRFEHIWTRPTPGTAGRGSNAVPGIMAVMPHHRRMAFGYGTSVPTRGLGAVIASRNGVGRAEGRRAEAKWLAAAVGTGLLCSAAVS